MNRPMAVAAALACLVISTGCSRHLTDFTVISTKKNLLAADETEARRVSGMDCVPVVLVQWGEPDLQAAIDKAIESAGPGYHALVDGAVYHRYHYFLFGRDCWEVEGTAVSRGATAAQ